jgi:hypothetical protein
MELRVSGSFDRRNYFGLEIASATCLSSRLTEIGRCSRKIYKTASIVSATMN